MNFSVELDIIFKSGRRKLAFSLRPLPSDRPTSRCEFFSIDERIRKERSSSYDSGTGHLLQLGCLHTLHCMYRAFESVSGIICPLECAPRRICVSIRVCTCLYVCILNGTIGVVVVVVVEEALLTCVGDVIIIFGHMVNIITVIVAKYIIFRTL